MRNSDIKSSTHSNKRESVVEMTVQEISLQTVALDTNRSLTNNDEAELIENRDERFYSIVESKTLPIENERRLSTLYDHWISGDPKDFQRQIIETYRVNRIYSVRKSDKNKQKMDEYRFSFNITQLMLAQMNASPSFTGFIVFNILIDTLFRINFVCFMVIAAFENPQYLKTLMVFLYLPRIMHIFTLTSLLFLNKYNPYNRPLWNLSYLIRSNFIKENSIVDENIHPFKRVSRLKVLTCRSATFMLLPIEICIVVLPLKTREDRRRALKTFILTAYILKGIEAILFQPVLLILMLSKYYAFQDQYPDFYEKITLLMVIADIGKYILISTLVLVRGNRQKKIIKKRILSVIHAETLKSNGIIL